MKGRLNIIKQIMSARNESGADDFYAWKKRFFETGAGPAATVECAALLGGLTSVPAFAFAAGYQSALRCMFPFIEGRLASFCVTEKNGASPSAIETKIESSGGRYLLTGDKSFATMALESDLFLVCAFDRIDDAGIKNLRLASVEKKSSGVAVNPFELPFAREVSHAAVSFTRVELPLESILPGDGYARYVKPFRTVEDIHLFAAFAGFLFARGIEMGWPKTLLEKCAAVLSALLGLSGSEPDLPETVIAVSGIKEFFDSILQEAALYGISKDFTEEERWKGDSKLFSVAGKIRRKRTDRGWESLLG